MRISDRRGTGAPHRRPSSLLILLLPAALLGLGGAPVLQPAFQPVAQGVEAATVTADGGVKAALLRVDTSRALLRVVDVRDPADKRHKTTAEVINSGAHVAAVNGGFFDLDGSPMGLLVSDGKQLGKLRKVDWGVFYIAGGKASIVHTKEYKAPRNVSQALQSGPRLVVDGKAVKLKPQTSRRSAVGIDADGRVLLLTTSSPLPAGALARVMLDLGCVQALNLDGGPSAQMSVKSPLVNENIAGGTPVPVMLVVDTVPLDEAAIREARAAAEARGGSGGCR